MSLNTLTPLKNLAKASIELRELRNLVSGHLKFHKIVFGEFEILNLLKDKKSIQPSHITAELAHETATVSRLLGRLHDNNYISYNYDEGDRRRVFVKIRMMERIKSILYWKHLNTINLMLTKRYSHSSSDLDHS